MRGRHGRQKLNVVEHFTLLWYCDSQNSRSRSVYILGDSIAESLRAILQLPTDTRHVIDSIDRGIQS